MAWPVPPREPFIAIRRVPYEEPYATLLEIGASNGTFSGALDLYCDVEDLSQIARTLKTFPKHIGDEYRYERGSKDPAQRAAYYFLLHASTVDSVGHCRLQIEICDNDPEPHDRFCRFSISAEGAAINRLGELIERLAAAPDSEFTWTPNTARD